MNGITTLNGLTKREEREIEISFVQDPIRKIRFTIDDLGDDMPDIYLQVNYNVDNDEVIDVVKIIDTNKDAEQEYIDGLFQQYNDYEEYYQDQINSATNN